MNLSKSGIVGECPSGNAESKESSTALTAISSTSSTERNLSLKDESAFSHMVRYFPMHAESSLH